MVWERIAWAKNTIVVTVAKNTSLGYRDPKIVCLHLASVCMCVRVCVSLVVSNIATGNPHRYDFPVKNKGILHSHVWLAKGILLIRFIPSRKCCPPTSNLHTLIIHVHPKYVLWIEGIYQSIYISYSYNIIYTYRYIVGKRWEALFLQRSASSFRLAFL